MPSDGNSYQLEIFILDDEEVIRTSLQEHFLRRGHKVSTFQHTDEFMASCASAPVDLALIDIRLQDANGLDVLKRVQEELSGLAVIMISGHGTIDHAIDALRFGAMDYIRKPIRFRELDASVQRLQRMLQAEQERDLLQATMARGLAHHSAQVIFGDDQASQKLHDFLKIAQKKPIDGLLITGETGTGKDVFAREVHVRQHGSEKPFIVVNCPALPEQLIESELFGHRKGAFTGAVDNRPGAFELADGGTLFLDEIGDLPLVAQAKILRILEERSVQRIGEAKSRSVSCTVVAATNRDVWGMVARAEFREDLLFRLNRAHVALPSLRDRPGDILPLARAFLAHVSLRHGYAETPYQLSSLAKEALLSYDFPGNIRELRHAIERAALYADDHVVQADHLGLVSPTDQSSTAVVVDDHLLSKPPSPTPASASDVSLPNEGARVLAALQKHRWNRRATAVTLGMSYESLRWRIQKYGLQPNDS